MGKQSLMLLVGHRPVHYCKCCLCAWAEPTLRDSLSVKSASPDVLGVCLQRPFHPFICSAAPKGVIPGCNLFLDLDVHCTSLMHNICENSSLYLLLPK